MRTLILVCLSLLFISSLCKENLSPSIGIISIPFDDDDYPSVSSAGSCIHEDYFQWIEQGGARAVPIPFDLEPTTLNRLLSSVNGVLFTGGGLGLNFSSSYMHGVVQAWQTALSMKHYPVWGTCMGFQLISILAANDSSVLTSGQFDSEGLPLALNFTENVLTSRMFASASMSLIRDLATQPITANFHHDGMVPEEYEENDLLKNFYKVISTNEDRKGKEFVSIIEGRHHPVYGVQFHPETTQFVWGLDGVPKQTSALFASQYLSNFLVSESRKNGNSFTDEFPIEKYDRYNYPLLEKEGYGRVYVLPPFGFKSTM